MRLFAEDAAVVLTALIDGRSLTGPREIAAVERIRDMEYVGRGQRCGPCEYDGGGCCHDRAARAKAEDDAKLRAEVEASVRREIEAKVRADSMARVPGAGGVG